MSRPRFSLVLRGLRGTAAKQRYLDRLEGLGQGENVGNGSAKPDSIKLAIIPFTASLGTDTYLQASAFLPSWDTLKASIGNRARVGIAAAGNPKTIAEEDALLAVRGFKAARVISRSKDASGTAATSKLTGLRYLKYNRTSVSAPFGQASAATPSVLVDEFNAIATAIGSTRSVSYSPELF